MLDLRVRLAEPDDLDLIDQLTEIALGDDEPNHPDAPGNLCAAIMKQEDVELILRMLDEVSYRNDLQSFVMGRTLALAREWKNSPSQELRLAGKSVEAELDLLPK